MLNKHNIIKGCGFFSALIALPFFVSAAWLVPTQTPPNANTEGPLNTGATLQIKNGDFSVNAFSALLDSFFADKLGVGTTPSLFTTLDVNPVVTLATSLLNIKSSIIYNGSTAMTNYYGAYIATPEGSGTITNTYALVTEAGAGKVGFGTIAPVSQLSVAGGIQVGDDTATCTSGKYGTLRWHNSVIEVCGGGTWTDVRNGISCQATGGAPTTADGGTVSTNGTASVVEGQTCPTATISTCTNGTWSPTPAAYANCIVEQPNYGCMDSGACNYDVNANIDNQSCYFVGDPCTSGSNNCGDTNSGVIISGCACNANVPADLESCPEEDNSSTDGCTDSGALNYNSSATNDDGSCVYPVTCADNPCESDMTCDDSSGSISCGCPEGTYELYTGDCEPNDYCPWWGMDQNGNPC